MKIAIVYDWIDKWGGVERLLLQLHNMYPTADFYTSFYDEKNASWAKNLRVKTSFMQRLPSIIKKNRVLSLLFFPYAFETFQFSDYDLVISVTSSFAKGIITKPNTKHICILLTPTRFLWSHEEAYQDSFIRLLGKPFVDRLKHWDNIASKRPDKIISISKHIAERCKKYYKRSSVMIYPPFNSAYWNKLSHPKGGSEHMDNTNLYYLVVSRLEPYKKIDLVINAFNKNRKKLIIIGKGTQERKLKFLAKENIIFVKNISDKELAQYYQNAEALIMPQDEDFGYTSLEAQFFGCPVISYKRSGAAETIVEEKTGIFFDKQTEKDLRDAIARFETMAYNIKNNLKTYESNYFRRWSGNAFMAAIKKEISKTI